MAAPSVKSITMRDAKDIFGKIAKSNHYVVSFSQLNTTLIKHLSDNYSIPIDDGTFVSRNLGLLCSDASLPTSSFATAEVKDNYIGVPQEFAHTRLYTDIDFTFYVDSDYKVLRIFEGWMDYISGGSEIPQSASGSYYRRFNYPKFYKVDTLYISKIERNLKTQLDYQFINAFPKGMTAIPVSYGGADLLKVTVSFNYDRYIVNRKTVKVEVDEGGLEGEEIINATLANRNRSSGSPVNPASRPRTRGQVLGYDR